MGKRIKLDMSDTIKRLEAKDKKDPYWGTGGSKGGTFNVDKMQKVKKHVPNKVNEA